MLVLPVAPFPFFTYTTLHISYCQLSFHSSNSTDTCVHQWDHTYRLASQVKCIFAKPTPSSHQQWAPSLGNALEFHLLILLLNLLSTRALCVQQAVADIFLIILSLTYYDHLAFSTQSVQVQCREWVFTKTNINKDNNKTHYFHTVHCSITSPLTFLFSFWLCWWCSPSDYLSDYRPFRSLSPKIVASAECICLVHLLLAIGFWEQLQLPLTT